MGLLNGKIDPSVLLNSLGLLGSKYEDQAARYHQGLLGSIQSREERARQAKADQQAAELHRAKMEELRRQREGRSRYLELLGQKAGPHEYDMFPGEQPIPGLKNEAKGYLGGLISDKEFAASAAQNPEYAAAAFGLLKETLPDSDGVAAGDWLKMGYKSRKEMEDAQLKVRGEFDKRMKEQGLTKTKDSFNRASNLVYERGGLKRLTGPDDVAMIKAYANMLLPGEAVMSDDVNILEDASGIPEAAKAFLARLSGDGTLSDTARRELYAAMTSVHNGAIQTEGKLRGKWLGQIGDVGLNAQDVFTDFAVPYGHMQDAQWLQPPGQGRPGVGTNGEKLIDAPIDPDVGY